METSDHELQGRPMRFTPVSFWLATLIVAWATPPPISFNAPRAFSPANGAGYVLVATGGKADVAAADGGTVAILLGKGDGTFRPPLNYTVGFSSFSIVAADFNGDGNLDLAVDVQPIAGNTPFGVAVLLGNGDGTFQPALPLTATPGDGQLAVGDFNHDGIPDLVTICNFGLACNSSNAVSILLGNGDGTFQPAVNYYAAGKFPIGIAVGDFNRDGKPDVAVTSDNCSFPCSTLTLSILLGSGDGTFRPGATYTIASGGSIAVADFNHDGKLDLAVASLDPIGGKNLVTFSSARLSVELSEAFPRLFPHGQNVYVSATPW